MKQGTWMRLLCVLIILWPFVNEIQAQKRLFYLQARRLDDPSRTILDSPYQETITVSQMLPIEVFLVFENKDDEDYEYSLLYKDKVQLPLYFGAWRDTTVLSTQKGKVDTLKRILYLRPTGTGLLEFTIQGLLKEKWGKAAAFQKFSINVIPADPDMIPSLVPDSASTAIGYSAGSTMHLDWKPASGTGTALSQDVYAFSAKDPATLVQSMKRLYKTTDGLSHAVFENLQDGQEYGYFARADFLTSDGPVMMVSDLFRCVQDNSPPGKVNEPIVVPEENGHRVSWDQVQDAVSGVGKYVIYRASDTGQESIVHVMNAHANPFYVWMDEDIDPQVRYYYRVRAVDRVGNMGDGFRSDPVDADTEFPSNNDIVFPEVEEQTVNGILYVAGTADTIPLIRADNLDSIRVISVRNEMSFFDNPPDLGMRVFDSGSITAPFPPYWVLDYGFHGSVQVLPDGQVVRGPGGMIDPNFVNGQTYNPIVTYYFRHSKTIVDTLVPRVMDCFPPEDVRNVRVQSVIADAPAYTEWNMQLVWEKPEDDQGSPMAGYHVFRRLNETGPFAEIAVVEPDRTFYVDADVLEPGSPVNPRITYRVVAEDAAGNMRLVDACAWDATDRALNAPEPGFSVRNQLETLIRDTLYTHASDAILSLKNFDVPAAGQFLVSVNGQTRSYNNPGNEFLTVTLDPADLTSEIRLRAVYKGGRSSVWSSAVIAVEDSVPPSMLKVTNHPDSSFGHLYLEWDRTSLAADKYHIYRSADGQVFRRVATVPANRDTMRWTDRERLVAYDYYTYKVQPYTKTNRLGEFSNTDSDYCNRPPKTFRHTVVDRENGHFEISIEWNRGWPISVPNSFVTDVSIYRDYMNQVLPSAIVSTEPMDTSFVFYDALLRHNYIFRLVEKLDNDSLDRTSGLSLPYTVSLKALEMEALTQPKKKIFLSWDRTITDTLDVTGFHLIRSENDQIQVDTLLSPGQFTYIDQDPSLIHNHMYDYRVIALNKYHHVLAANDTTVLCDSGLVYIPTIDPLPAYFNGRSLPICWHWEMDGVIDTTTTRGADKLLLQISTKSGFPATPEGQTVEYQIPADPGSRCGSFEIPPNAGNVNSQLWIRMYAMDKWDNPHPRIESNRGFTKYDSVYPIQVDSFHVDAVHALNTADDSVVVTLTWNDVSLLDQNELVSNVSYYRLLRGSGGAETVAGIWPGVLNQLNYTFRDTVSNLPFSWRLVSVDAAGNETTNGWIQAPVFVETPDSSALDPLEFRSCLVHGLPDNAREYFVEIAMFDDHFKLAHELDGDQLDFLLCRSGWISSMTDTFTCSTGWGGNFVMDTTYFRLKTRYGTGWESGWSDIRIFTQSMGKTDGVSAVAGDSRIPDRFEVAPNFPNPFNSTTVIKYGLPEAAHTRVRIFNCTGALVCVLVDRTMSAGFHECQWNGHAQAGEPVATGVYIYEVSAETETRDHYISRFKMMLLK
ncbi:hypothetical protein JW948_18745 [bacterium]|nr:hypothetical protein [bacterium]